MSRRISPLTVTEFLVVLEFAKKIHAEKEEPIPSFHESKINELESCLQTPFQSFGGISLYKGLVNKASMLFYLLARNHVLSNGNKRMACLCMSFFCFKNGYHLLIPEQVLYHLAKYTVMAKEV